MGIGITDERQANPILCEVLSSKLPGWICDAERNRVIKEDPSLTPDLSFLRGDTLVLGEAKWEQNDTQDERGVEAYARKRLGLHFGQRTSPIEHCLAIKMPYQLLETAHSDLSRAFLDTSDLQWALFSMEDGSLSGIRLPDRGWITGGVDDLAGTIESVPMSKSAMERSYKLLDDGVKRAGHELSSLKPVVSKEVSRILFTTDFGESSMRMAATIICNALLFQQRLEESMPEVSLVDCYMELNHEQPDWLKIKSAWNSILAKNYAPIFQIARSLLETIPDDERRVVLRILACTSRELHSLELDPTHDLIGRVFQRMFVDRQKLATYYTRPETSSLLAEFALNKIDVDWSKPEEVSKLVFADFACGTGTLLTSTYQGILSRLRRGGIDPVNLHSKFMQESIVGLDVLPTASHMTTSILASVFPDVIFENVRIATAPYGRDTEGRTFVESTEEDSVFLGSLEFLARGSGSALFDSIKQQSGVDSGESPSNHDPDDQLLGISQITSFELQNDSVDLAIMNPPFSTPTHSQADEIEQWAGFGTSKKDQERMNQKFKRIKKKFQDRYGFVGTGYAGIASNFFDLALLKLKPGGVMAMISPLTLVRGNGWNNTRKLLASWFRDLVIFTLAPTEGDGAEESRAFSADTGMGECMVVGVKREKPIEIKESDQTTTLITLYGVPNTLVESKIASQILSENTNPPGGGGGGGVNGYISVLPTSGIPLKVSLSGWVVTPE